MSKLTPDDDFRSADPGSDARIQRERQELEDERAAWALEREGLNRELVDLRARLERVSSLLRDERAAIDAELDLGAAELDRRDKEIASLQHRRDQLIRQRNKARRLLDESLYEESRGVRFAARVVRRVRGLRGSRD